ncbi:MAG: (deoxy)nucleoside triphosphate pyrophosphohydrolase [Planctomycetes bacterium]|nr:(deoxy)nucleoside triphosphate pyrophosphohydrolase [Planctomycetota bacterium]
MPGSECTVAVALVSRAGKWLVSRRLPHVHVGGLWEFPGGKIAADEGPMLAAVRELREECGVVAAALRPLPAVTCDYGDRTVHITPVLCHWESGEADPIQSAAIRWVSFDELRLLEMPAANAEILRILIRECAGCPHPQDW